MAIRSSGDHIKSLVRQGYPEETISVVIQQMTQGLCSQLYNCPLDMYVESRLASGFQAIEVCQFSSLQRIYTESLRVATDKEIKNLTPSKLYHASVSMNCATAIFLDHLFGARTSYSSPYRATNTFETGMSLFELWKSQEIAHNPGEEYLLVDQFADILELAQWYEWKPDVEGEPAPSNGIERTKFADRQSETLMFCLDALRRFERRSSEEVLETVGEIALLGNGGIDYTTPGRVYEIRAFPEESFTGLNLLCLMHVGLRRVNPTLETGLDLDDAYKLALEAYNKRLQ